MKKNIAVLLSLILVFSACSNTNINKLTEAEKEGPDSIIQQTEPISSMETVDVLSYDEFLNNLSSNEKSWSGLSSEQYIEDFDYMYQQLKENYSYFGVAKRKKDLDFDECYIQTRNKLESCTNDFDFLFILKTNFTVSYIGHLYVWETTYFETLTMFKDLSRKNSGARINLAPYIKALENPISEKNYEGVQAFYSKQEQAYDTYLKDIGKTEFQKEPEQISNVKTEILEEGKIAYIYIKSFDMGSYDSDKKLLFDFYDKVANYEHLIFDISQNGGGGMPYFTDLMAAPNIDKTLSVPVYQFVKAGKNNIDFLNLNEGIKSGRWKPISEAPYLPKMNKYDLKELDYFNDSSYTINPLKKEKMFKGRIWMLVSEKNYSASESAAMFSKNTGFATLVGTKTSGDGIGATPVYIILPNSGFIIQYSPIYGTTADGANSEEFGTNPDFESPEGETPLDTCLKLIQANR